MGRFVVAVLALLFVACVAVEARSERFKTASGY
jgi:hypothetical protein